MEAVCGASRRVWLGHVGALLFVLLFGRWYFALGSFSRRPQLPREVQHGEKDLRCQQDEFLLQGEFQTQEGQTDNAAGIPLGVLYHPQLRPYTAKIPM